WSTRPASRPSRRRWDHPRPSPSRRRDDHRKSPNSWRFAVAPPSLVLVRGVVGIEGEKGCAAIDLLALGDQDFANRSRARRADDVLHLHRFHHDQRFADVDVLSGADAYVENQSGHRRVEPTRRGLTLLNFEARDDAKRNGAAKDLHEERVGRSRHARRRPVPIDFKVNRSRAPVVDSRVTLWPEIKRPVATRGVVDVDLFMTETQRRALAREPRVAPAARHLLQDRGVGPTLALEPEGARAGRRHQLLFAEEKFTGWIEALDEVGRRVARQKVFAS